MTLVMHVANMAVVPTGCSPVRYAGCDLWSQRLETSQRIVIDTTDGKRPMQQAQGAIDVMRKLSHVK